MCSADVERGLWAPGVDRKTEGPKSPTFHEFASEWLAARRGELGEATIADYTWQLCNHLLPFFHAHRLPQISVAEVDRYREFKVREQVLSAESINKTITRLGQILAVAEERDLIIRNSVRVNTRNRKLKAKRKRPVFLDSAEQIVAMIDAATELDAKPEARTAGRRALIATLIYAGLRIGEATALTWQDIDFANGRISVGDAKTQAGIRRVDIPPRPPRRAHQPPPSTRGRRTDRAGPPDLDGEPPRQGQRPRARDPPGRRSRQRAARAARQDAAAGGRQRARTPPYVRVDPLRPR
jgi:integrase